MLGTKPWSDGQDSSYFCTGGTCRDKLEAAQVYPKVERDNNQREQRRHSEVDSCDQWWFATRKRGDCDRQQPDKL